MKRKPELLSLFAYQPVPGDCSHSSSRRVSRASSTVDLLKLVQNFDPNTAVDGQKNKEGGLLKDYDGRHLLISAILNYVDSTDYIVSCQAMVREVHIKSLNLSRNKYFYNSKNDLSNFLI